MSIGTLGDYRRRRKRAVYLRLFLVLLFSVSLLGTASYAYQVGVQASEAKAEKVSSELERFQSDNLALRDRLAAEAAEAERVERSLAVLERRYQAEVPHGDLRRLMEAVREQVDQGVEVDRLALLIEAAGRPPACAEAPETKRFMPSTSVGSQAVHAVRFGNGRILVQGEGTSARNEQGLAEAWFDPVEPVRLRFSTLAGQSEDVTGVLPLQHRMVAGEREYRFSIIASERAFIEIAAQSCALPEISSGPEEVEVEPEDRRGAVTSG